MTEQPESAQSVDTKSKKKRRAWIIAIAAVVAIWGLTVNLRRADLELHPHDVILESVRELPEFMAQLGSTRVWTQKMWAVFIARAERQPSLRGKPR